MYTILETDCSEYQFLESATALMACLWASCSHLAGPWENRMLDKMDLWFNPSGPPQACPLLWPGIWLLLLCYGSLWIWIRCQFGEMFVFCCCFFGVLAFLIRSGWVCLKLILLIHLFTVAPLFSSPPTPTAATN